MAKKVSIAMGRKNLGPRHLRGAIKRGIVVAPGVFNGISALIAERYGFDALYLSGSGIAGAMGLPDLSMTTMSEVLEETRRITLVSRAPLIVDVDTGFGEVLNVERTVMEMERAGASAIHIEDQVLPKKCGHLEGKVLINEYEMVQKIRAAVKSKRNKDFMIIARTDARAIEGIDGAIQRAKSYLKAGADGIFPEALENEEEFREFASKVKGVLLANMTEFGKSPLLPARELERMGYRIVIFPLTAFRASLLTMEEVYSTLSSSGTQEKILEKIMSRKKFYDIIGYEAYELEDRLLSQKHRKTMK
ncbi:MAG: methylisocitrate lyase [Thermoplasmata archaeon]